MLLHELDTFRCAFAPWLDCRTTSLAKEKQERIWSKEHVTLRSCQIVDDFRKISERCQKLFGSWSEGRDETYASRLGLALFKAYKLALMIRNASGLYMSAMDCDELRLRSTELRSSVLKFSPQFIIAPGKMVRMIAIKQAS